MPDLDSLVLVQSAAGLRFKIARQPNQCVNGMSVRVGLQVPKIGIPSFLPSFLPSAQFPVKMAIRNVSKTSKKFLFFFWRRFPNGGVSGNLSSWKTDLSG